MEANANAAESPAAEATKRLLALPVSLRSEVRWHVRGDSTAAVAEDPLTGKNYRVGVAEYRFCVHADGAGDFDEAWRRFEPSNTEAAAPLSRKQAEAVYLWLHRSGIASGTAATSRTPQQPLWQKVNPISVRQSLGNPDKLLEGLVAVCKGFDPRLVFVAIACLLLAAAWTLLENAEQFSTDLERLVTTGRIASLCVLWCVLKVVHELGHGLACKWFGGRVTDAGVVFILFAPIAYTDVTSSAAFPHRWRRVVVALAGIAAELCVAAVALLVWRYSSSPEVRRVAGDAVLMGTFVTIAFNANPLMRLDGYYVLAECLRIDNLYDKAQKALRGVVGGVLGTQPAAALSNPATLGLAAYGLGCLAWRMVVAVALITGAASLMHGAGLILAVFAAFAWFVAPAFRAARGWLSSQGKPDAPGAQAALRGLGVAAAMVVVACLAPSPDRHAAPAVVQFDPSAPIRCSTPGFVKTVHVSDGQQVRRGAVLLTLHNEQLLQDLASVDTECQLAKQRERTYEWQGDASKLLQARAETEGLEQRRAELQRKADALVVRAESDGAVISRRIQDLEGVYLSEGESVGEVGDAGSKRLLISLTPSEADDLATGEYVRFVSLAGRAWSGTVSRVEPRASLQPPHLALTALFDGPLAVQSEASEDPLLVEPRVTAYASLAPDSGSRLLCGQRCTAFLSGGPRSLFGWAYDKLWILLTV